MKFLAQCVSGLQDVAVRQLAFEAFSPTILDIDDGLVVFETRAFPTGLRDLAYLNNCFQILAEDGGSNDHAGMDEFLRWLAALRTLPRELTRCTTPGERTFRLVLSDRNRLVAADNQAIGRLGAVIEQATRLGWSPRGADAEFWALLRDDGRRFFAKRLSRRAKTERDLLPGELKPELATLLCLLAEPAAEDIVLDPFAGTGAIPFARAAWPYNMIFALDSDPARVTLMKERIKAGGHVKLRKNSPLVARQGDARALERIEDGFIHKVITDPPWGLFDDTLDDLPGFYRAVLAELARLTRPGGLIVMLLGRRELAGPLVRDVSDRLRLEDSPDILVSGKQATVLKWRRTGGP